MSQCLTKPQMQAIATEFNYSETTFILPPREPDHTAQVRIFTSRTEVPFAGHPNIGTAVALTAPERLSIGSTIPIADAAASVSLSPRDVVTSTHSPQVISVGLPFLVMELASRDALLHAKPDAASGHRKR